MQTLKPKPGQKAARHVGFGKKEDPCSAGEGYDPDWVGVSPLGNWLVVQWVTGDPGRSVKEDLGLVPLVYAYARYQASDRFALELEADGYAQIRAGAEA